jgi:hypothetical protein
VKEGQTRKKGRQGEARWQEERMVGDKAVIGRKERDQWIGNKGRDTRMKPGILLKRKTRKEEESKIEERGENEVLGICKEKEERKSDIKSEGRGRKGRE